MLAISFIVDAFRASIQPLYYFSPLTLAARPLVLPVEQGSLVFTVGRVQKNTAVTTYNDLETRRHGVYEVYKVQPEDVGDDSCSLNRFMRMRAGTPQRDMHSATHELMLMGKWMLDN